MSGNAEQFFSLSTDQERGRNEEDDELRECETKYKLSERSLEELVEKIRNENGRVVVIQSSNEFPNLSIECLTYLRRMNDKKEYYLMADQLTSDCCVDYISGEHCDCDIIVYVGTDYCGNNLRRWKEKKKISVFFIRPQLIDLSLPMEKLRELFRLNSNQKFAVWTHGSIYDELGKTFREDENVKLMRFIDNSQYGEGWIFLGRLIPYHLKRFLEKDCIHVYLSTNDEDVEDVLKIFSLNISSPHNYFMYLKDDRLLSIQHLYNEKMTMISGKVIEENIQLTNRIKRHQRKRNYMIEKLREGDGIQSIGIIRTISQEKEKKNSMFDLIKWMLMYSKFKYFELSMNKINECKLANFHQLVNIFVMVGCQRSIYSNSEIDSYSVGIVSPTELLIALTNDINRYNYLFYERLEKMINDPHTDIELVKKHLCVEERRIMTKENEEEKEVMERTKEYIINNIVAIDEELMDNREFKGIALNISQHPLAAAEEGLSGIASQYENEGAHDANRINPNF
ncbi:hypothetical protein SNEBB_010795 [Seison nebaliae]|nr:hypothetical protein SNEBB_010795 [Seison nebaliae]